MSSIRTQFLHKGIMLGICLMGVLLSTIFIGNDSEYSDDTLLVGHHIENPSEEKEYQSNGSLEQPDSTLGVTETHSEVE
ncbi:hypothetical protein ACA086_12245 [Muriicola sp. E247]|uniref:hypothetical protein n=1 Tax=Muriicola sp. E247 TaxID=3242730 RepID=UPI003524EBCE